ncbi:MAG: hypothetical protein M5U15_14085 [Kiritimatiellae bacterium]|nr:hypothetical protein [Kiritimatiellia bacterium]
MGYDPNVHPSRRWFAGRMFIEKTKQIHDEKAKLSAISFDDLIDLFEARLNIIRGFRAAFLLPPDNGEDFDKMIEELETKLEEGSFKKFSKLISEDFKIRYSGTGQYGVANYELRNMKTQKSCSISKQESKTFQMLLRQAFRERVNNLAQLLECTEDVFFEEIYLIDKRDELYYCHPFELFDEDEIYEMIVDGGFAKSIEQAEAKFPEIDDIEDKGVLDFFEDYHVNVLRAMHHDLFWDWCERDSIFHG